MGEFDTEEYASLKLKAPNNNIGSVEKCVRSTKLSPPERTDDIKKWLQYACTHDYAHGKTRLVEVFGRCALSCWKNSSRHAFCQNSVSIMGI